MAEIKSTLELIMEKTKDLTLTDAEKRALHEKELQGKIRGLLVKCLDGLLKIEDLKKETAGFEEKDQGFVKEVLLKESIDKIHLKSDNRPVLNILKEVVQMDITAIEKHISDCLKELDQAKDIREKGLFQRIQEKGISGSAVLPNCHADEEWIRFEQKVDAAFRREIQTLAI